MVDPAGQIGEAARDSCLALDAAPDLPAVPDPDRVADRILKALTLSGELADAVGEVAAVAAVEEVADSFGLAVCRPGDGREGRVPRIGRGHISAPHRTGKAPCFVTGREDRGDPCLLCCGGYAARGDRISALLR